MEVSEYASVRDYSAVDRQIDEIASIGNRILTNRLNLENF